VQRAIQRTSEDAPLFFEEITKLAGGSAYWIAEIATGGPASDEDSEPCRAIAVAFVFSPSGEIHSRNG
jgi:hypothetical protein